MNTTDAGRLGEAKTLSRLVEMGWYPFVDISGKCPVDIIAWKDGVTKTFQVKSTSKITRFGSYMVQIGRVRSNTKETTIYKFDSESCDYLVVYVEPTDKVYFIPSEEVKGGRQLNITEKHDAFLTWKV